MSREDKRKQQRLLESIKRKAVKDMNDWLLTLPDGPTQREILAYKAGYVAGINRKETDNG